MLGSCTIISSACFESEDKHGLNGNKKEIGTISTYTHTIHYF